MCFQQLHKIISSWVKLEEKFDSSLILSPLPSLSLLWQGTHAQGTLPCTCLSKKKCVEKNEGEIGSTEKRYGRSKREHRGRSEEREERTEENFLLSSLPYAHMRAHNGMRERGSREKDRRKTLSFSLSLKCAHENMQGSMDSCGSERRK